MAYFLFWSKNMLPYPDTYRHFYMLIKAFLGLFLLFLLVSSTILTSLGGFAIFFFVEIFRWIGKLVCTSIFKIWLCSPSVHLLKSFTAWVLKFLKTMFYILCCANWRLKGIECKFPSLGNEWTMWNMKNKIIQGVQKVVTNISFCYVLLQVRGFITTGKFSKYIKEYYSSICSLSPPDNT